MFFGGLILCQAGSVAQNLAHFSRWQLSTGVSRVISQNEPYTDNHPSMGGFIKLASQVGKQHVYGLVSGHQYMSNWANFNALRFTVGYQHLLTPSYKYKVAPFAGIGNQYLMFTDTKGVGLNKAYKHESELTYEIGLNLQLVLNKRFALLTQGVYAYTYSYQRQHQLFVQGGLVYLFKAPEGITKFLQ